MKSTVRRYSMLALSLLGFLAKAGTHNLRRDDRHCLGYWTISVQWRPTAVVILDMEEEEVTARVMERAMADSMVVATVQPHGGYGGMYTLPHSRHYTGGYSPGYGGKQASYGQGGYSTGGYGGGNQGGYAAGYY
ncbi:hypothetical protein MTO96_037566 [Rhipicephalus appendiculatus]